MIFQSICNLFIAQQLYKMSGSHAIPGTSIGRPTQREDFSHETATVSLAGESYFFSGPARSYGRVHRGMANQPKLDFDHRTGSGKTAYIILGPDPHFFQCLRYTRGVLPQEASGIPFVVIELTDHQGQTVLSLRIMGRSQIFIQNMMLNAHHSYISVLTRLSTLV
ncbi:hypothetical protein NW765_016253 [Fusarium oxysporum]|nr:hypothetical protein NW765_016253 [Fusarium oxysporum]